MVKKLWKYLKSERGEVGPEEAQKLQEKIDLLESENSQLKDEKDTVSDELKIYQQEGKSENELNTQRVSDLEKENEALKTKEKDNQVAIDRLSIEKDFPELDSELIGKGSLEDMKKRAQKLRDFKTKTIADERGMSVVDLQEEFKKVPGAQGEFNQKVVKEKKDEADNEINKQMKEGTSAGVLKAILGKVGMGGK